MGDIVTVGGLFPLVTQTEYFYHANIVAADSGSSKVYLSASGRSHDVTSGGIQTGSEFELYECSQGMPGGKGVFEKCKQSEAKVRARLDTLAMRIKQVQ